MNLERVLWLGGSPCAGKSSVSSILAERHGLAVYHVDEHTEAHVERAGPDHPTLARLGRRSGDALWMRPLPEQIADEHEFCREEFSLALEDIAALPGGGPLLAEGTSLLPGSVAALGVPPARAIWLVPAPAFQREHYARRPWVKDVLRGCADPERAFENWMARDVAFGARVAEEASGLGYRVVVVDGSSPLPEVAGLVERHLGLGEVLP